MTADALIWKARHCGTHAFFEVFHRCHYATADYHGIGGIGKEYGVDELAEIAAEFAPDVESRSVAGGYTRGKFGTVSIIYVIEEETAAIVLVVARAERKRADFAGSGTVAAIEAPVDYNAGADTVCKKLVFAFWGLG